METHAARAVFLSYASQDAEAARRIADALRAPGVEVWFDRSELRGGDAWDQKIRKQIQECALFLPVISATTQTRLEGYFRIEWKLAAQRTYAMAEARPFLLPVVIDATRDAEAHVPPEFKAVQWTRLPNGETPAPFVERVQALLVCGLVAGVADPLAARAGFAEQKPGDRIGHYKLVEKIGEGGCGIVWRAEQEQPVHRRVALKVIKLGMDTKEVIGRFEAERQALALMDHPNIARVFDAGTTDTGRPFFVMELVRGVPITRFCDEHNLPTAARLDLFVQVCHAIQHAHQKGIIHRDIKPSNILVALQDDAPLTKVIDFGIAKATTGRLTDQTVFTAVEQLIGTPAYMSPEQAEMSGLDVDTSSDIYSLGVLLYELLTGGTPFDRSELVRAGWDEMRRTIREEEPPRPSTRLSKMHAEGAGELARRRGVDVPRLVALVRGDLDWIVMKCLEKDRTRRYETANGLATDIIRHLHHEPVTACPPSTAYRFRKLVRRNQLAFAAAAAVILALMLGLVGSRWQAVRATRAERDQNVQRQIAEKARTEAETQRRRAETGELLARRRSYAADMNLVQPALVLDKLGRAQELLNRQRPKAGETDLRGWEWRYLWQLCQSDAQSMLCTKSNPISSLSVSPDGKLVAVSEQFDGGLSIHNIETREEVRVPAGKGFVRAVFSPQGRLLAVAVNPDPTSGETRHRILLWDVNARQAVRELVIADGALDWQCTGLIFSEDGGTLATSMAGPQNEIRLWRMADGQKLASYPAPSGDVGYWNHFAVSRDFKIAAYKAVSGALSVADLANGLERWRTDLRFSSLTLAFSPDGQLLISGGDWSDPAVRIFDVTSGREVGRLEGHRGAVLRFVFSPDGASLASAGDDHTIRLWDVTNRRLLHTLRGHKSAVWNLAWLPDNRTLVSGCKDGSVYVWDVTARRVSDAISVLPTEVWDWRFAADGKSVVTCISDRVVEWRGRNFQDETLLIEAKVNTEFKGRRQAAGLVKFASDCPLLAVGSGNGLVQVWDWGRRMLARKLQATDGRVYPLGFLDRGEKLIVGNQDDRGNLTVQEWNIGSGRETRSWPGLASTVRFESAFSPDGRQCILLDFAGAMSRIDLVAGREARIALNLRQPYPPSFSADSRFLAGPSALGYVRIWDATTLRELASLSGFAMSVNSAVFSPDGQRLATGSHHAESMRLWDMASHELLLTLETSEGFFAQTAFSPDGNILGSATRSGKLHLWRAPSWAQIEQAEFTAAEKP